MDCNFCGREITRGTGKIYAKKDGTVYNFCSTKCHKNQLQNKRKSMKMQWTETYHKQKKLVKK